MTALETIRAWIREYPGCGALQDLYVDCKYWRGQMVHVEAGG